MFNPESAISVTFPEKRSQANYRLFCFPYAGGNSGIFYNWHTYLPYEIEVCPIELPGRGIQISKTPYTDFFNLVKATSQVLLRYLDKPFAMFGHSMGAILCFEICRYLENQYQLIANSLFISACSPPQIYSKMKFFDNFDNFDNFSSVYYFLEKFGNTPKQVLHNQEFIDIILPTLLSDLKLSDNYTFNIGKKLSCPFIIFYGIDDINIYNKDLEFWCYLTKSSCLLQEITGNHFFLHYQKRMITNLIAQFLNKNY